MATRPGSPVRRSTRRAAPRRVHSNGARPVDVREWLGGIRLSGFMLIMLALVVLAVLTLVPTVGTYVGQKQRIAQLEQAVQVQRDKIDDLTAERDRWKDPAYLATQARERLYYVKPNELTYLVVNDVDPATLPAEQAPVSDMVQERTDNWMATMLRSVVGAGLARNATPAP